MAFAAFLPLLPSAREASVIAKQVPTNQYQSNGTYGIDIAGSNGADTNDLVGIISQLQKEVKTLENSHQKLQADLNNVKIGSASTISQLWEELKTLEERQQELRAELNYVRKDQMDQYVCARRHMHYTSKLCEQVERIIIKRKQSDAPALQAGQSVRREDGDAWSSQVEQIIKSENGDAQILKVLREIDSNILKTLEQYYAPGSNDPRRFQKQIALQKASYEAMQTKSAGHSPVPSPTAEGNQWKSVKLFCTTCR